MTYSMLLFILCMEGVHLNRWICVCVVNIYMTLSSYLEYFKFVSNVNTSENLNVAIAYELVEVKGST